MTILCYFKTSFVTFVQKITLKSMFSKEAYKSVASIFIYIYVFSIYVFSIFIYFYFTF
jgi:type III secretion system FlhB-like substrate exporter